MPQKQPISYKRLHVGFLFLCILAFSVISSCKSDKKTSSPADLFDGPNTINYTINGDQLSGADQINKDLTMLDYQEDRMNKDHVLYIPVFDSVYFKDISQFKEGAPGERQWFIDEQQLASVAGEVAFYSEEVGPAIVTLKYDDYNYVMKGVFFTDAFDFNDETASSDSMETDFDSSDESVDSYADNSSDYNEPTPSQPVAKTTPKPTPRPAASRPVQKPSPRTTPKPSPKPAPVQAPREITKVDFSVSKSSVETGEKVVFRDLSEPAIAVNQRVWDWGDGNTMPTRGSTAGYSFYKPGIYKVKLCLNYSSKCSTKTITVKQAAKAIVAAPKPAPKPAPTKTKVKVSKVVISSASQTLVGKPIQISDGSFPAEAIKSRTWYINGSATNLTNKKFSKTFEKPGTYTIKLCVNGSSMCESKTIKIEDKPKPAPVKKAVVASTEEEFFPMANSRTGLRTSQRCPEEDMKWHTGEAELTLKPTVRMELLNAKIFGKVVAQAAVTLTSSDGKVKRKINNVQILPGPSTIEFGDFSVVLQPGVSYTIKIMPMAGESNLALEDGGACNTSFAADDRLGVSYKDNVMTLFNVKFSY